MYYILYSLADRFVSTGEIGQTASRSRATKIYEDRPKRQTDGASKIYQTKGSE